MPNKLSIQRSKQLNAEFYWQEGAEIYAAIFNCKIPNKILNRYAEIALIMDAKNSYPMTANYEDAIRNCCDLEALEVASRLFRTHEQLVRKFRLMVFLAEMQPENLSLFVNEVDGKLSAVTQLVLVSLRYIYKVAFGSVLLWKYKDA